MKLTEYDVSFAVKEFVIKNGYTVITWNPPGSQGTFTIPNPAKDPTYKGQTGSESPDLIAFKNDEMLILEAKDSNKKCISDIYKIKDLLSNQPRKELLFNICNSQMKALGIDFNAYKCKIKMGIAIPNFINYDDIVREFPDISLYLVNQLIPSWNNKVINNKNEIQKAFSVTLIQK
mgnify:CR=1 FL=1